MDIARLSNNLSLQLQRPQKSERWAMYRLIMPIVDFAADSFDSIDFEHNQTSLHRTSQSVDIACLKEGAPQVFIEAKRIDRHISSDQVEKYLEEDTRGIVSNGIDWILCLNGRSLQIRIYDPAQRSVDQKAIERIVGFIRLLPVKTDEWNGKTLHVAPIVSPIRPIKPIKAKRNSNTKFSTHSLEDFTKAVDQLPTTIANQTALLKSIVERFNDVRGIPHWLKFEVRKSRIVFLNLKSSHGSNRIGRIELGKKQPDVLLLTSIVQMTPNIESTSKSNPHDKGKHMRRFRLWNEEQARIFGKQYVDALLSDTKD